MTKRFPITIENGKPTCPDLAGYELPEFKRTPIAIEVEMVHTCCGRYMNCKGCDATEDMILPIDPDLNPDGTVKGRWVYE